MSLNIPEFLKVVNHISLFKYGPLVLTRNGFHGLVFDCTQEKFTSGACPYPTGEAALELLKCKGVD